MVHIVFRCICILKTHLQSIKSNPTEAFEMRANKRVANFNQRNCVECIADAQKVHILCNANETRRGLLVGIVVVVSGIGGDNSVIIADSHPQYSRHTNRCTAVLERTFIRRRLKWYNMHTACCRVRHVFMYLCSLNGVCYAMNSLLAGDHERTSAHIMIIIVAYTLKCFSVVGDDEGSAAITDAAAAAAAFAGVVMFGCLTDGGVYIYIHLGASELTRTQLCTSRINVICKGTLG